MKTKTRFKSVLRDCGEQIKATFRVTALNWRPLLLFLLIFASTNVFATNVVIKAVLRVAKAAHGITYIAADNLKGFLLSPVTMLMALVGAIALTLIAIFQIGGLTRAYSMSYIGEKTTVRSMICSGLYYCRKSLHPKNWLIILFIMILAPLANAFAVSGATYYVTVPEFIDDFLMADKVFSALYTLVLWTLELVELAYVFSINFFMADDIAFLPACRLSRVLINRKYIRTVVSMAVISLLFSVITTFTAAGLTEVIVESYESVSSVYVATGNRLIELIAIAKRLILCVFNPAVNMCALTVLFFRYIDQDGRISEVFRAQVLEGEKYTKGKIIAFASGVAVVVVIGLFLNGGFATLDRELTRPAIVAHRGDSVHAPENTMAAFEMAVTENPEYLEFDVHETKDGVIIISHDDDLSRVSGQKLYVHDLTYAETQQLEVGSWFSANYSGLRLSTLDEALKFFRPYENLTLQIEIKPTGYDVDIEEKVLQIIRDNDMLGRCMITSLDLPTLLRVKELEPEIKTVYSMFVAEGEICDINVDDFTVEEGNVRPELVDRVHAEGKRIFAWTVNTSGKVQHLIDCGVDGILTDDPLMLKDALDSADYSGGIFRAMRLYSDRMINGY